MQILLLGRPWNPLSFLLWWCSATAVSWLVALSGGLLILNALTVPLPMIKFEVFYCMNKYINFMCVYAVL